MRAREGFEVRGPVPGIVSSRTDDRRYSLFNNSSVHLT